MYPLKQSTAITVPIFVHDANGDPVLGLTSGDFTGRISKGSGAFGALSVTITEMEKGFYSFPLTTTHSNTLGILTITFTHASAKQVNLQFRVDTNLNGDIATTVAAILADTGTDGVVLSAAQMNKIADHVIRRNLANARASSDGDTVAFRSLLGMASKLVNKVIPILSALKIYEEDDTTEFGSQTFTSTPASASNLISSLDTD
jgi:hypothetical protein